MFILLGAGRPQDALGLPFDGTPVTYNVQRHSESTKREEIASRGSAILKPSNVLICKSIAQENSLQLRSYGARRTEALVPRRTQWPGHRLGYHRVLCRQDDQQILQTEEVVLLMTWINAFNDSMSSLRTLQRVAPPHLFFQLCHFTSYMSEIFSLMHVFFASIYWHFFLNTRKSYIDDRQYALGCTKPTSGNIKSITEMILRSMRKKIFVIRVPIRISFSKILRYLLSVEWDGLLC